MQRASIASDTVTSIGYEAATSTLELEFSSGDVFQFYNVPLTVYIALIKAASKGDFYHHNIKAVYESKQVTEETINNNDSSINN